MPIKVLVISNYHNVHSVRPEAKIFLALAQMDFEIHIMTYASSPYWEEFKAAGIHLTDFQPTKKFDKAQIQRVRDYLHQHQIDILHLFNVKSYINGIQAARGMDVQLLLYRGFVGGLHWLDPTSLVKQLHPRVDYIMCNSQAVADSLSAHPFFDGKKAKVINKGHELAWYDGAPRYDLRAELGLSKDDFLLINSANNRTMKGIPYLLKTFNLLPNDLPIHLLLLGRNMDIDKNLKIIQKGDKAERVHFLGYRKNVLGILQDCDAFVLSSIKGESTTKALIEAMIMQLPSVTFDIPGNKDICIHNTTSLVNPLKDVAAFSQSILSLYHDRALGHRLGANARQHIHSRLNHQDTVRAVKAFYESLV